MPRSILRCWGRHLQFFYPEPSALSDVPGLSLGSTKVVIYNEICEFFYRQPAVLILVACPGTFWVPLITILTNNQLNHAKFYEFLNFFIFVLNTLLHIISAVFCPVSGKYRRRQMSGGPMIRVPNADNSVKFAHLFAILD